MSQSFQVLRDRMPLKTRLQAKQETYRMLEEIRRRQSALEQNSYRKGGRHSSNWSEFNN